jgi:hypothetical protein
MPGIPSSRPALLNKRTLVSKRLSKKDFLVIRRKGKLDGSCQRSGTVLRLFFGREVERELVKGGLGGSTTYILPALRRMTCLSHILVDESQNCGT